MLLDKKVLTKWVDMYFFKLKVIVISNKEKTDFIHFSITQRTREFCLLAYSLLILLDHICTLAWLLCHFCIWGLLSNLHFLDVLGIHVCYEACDGKNYDRYSILSIKFFCKSCKFTKLGNMVNETEKWSNWTLQLIKTVNLGERWISGPSWPSCLCRSLSTWVRVWWRTGGGASVIWVRVEITHIEEGDRTSVEANHNPEDGSHLGHYDVQSHGSQVGIDCCLRKVGCYEAKT